MAESISKSRWFFWRKKKKISNSSRAPRNIVKNDESMISNLPDSLLSHILSFLPTKDSVATSILSKRWKSLWRYTPTFHFSDEAYTQSKTQYLSFVEFVYAFLISRDAQVRIKRFQLECCSKFTSNSDIDIWVNNAMQRHVEHVEHVEIIVKNKHLDNISLPSSLFTSKTLVVLKLNRLQLKDLASVFLPSLKLLHLESIEVSDFWGLHKILSGCNLLENLTLKSIKFSKGVLTLLELLHIYINGHDKIKLTNLLSANVDLIAFTQLGDAKFLKFLRVERKGYPLEIFRISSFPNLVHLEFIFLHYPWITLANLLPFTPKLQVLVLNKEENMPNYYRKEDDEGFHVAASKYLSLAKVSSLSLRECHMKGFEGQENEMQFARYIMEKAPDFETFTICSSPKTDPVSKLKMLKELCSYQRSSSTCKLLFE